MFACSFLLSNVSHVAFASLIESSRWSSEEFWKELVALAMADASSSFVVLIIENRAKELSLARIVTFLCVLVVH